MKYDINKIYELPLLSQGLILCLCSLFMIGIGYQFIISDLNDRVRIQHQQEEKLLQDYKMIIDQQVDIKHHGIELPVLKKLTENKFITELELNALLDDLLKLASTNAVKFQLFDHKEKIKKNDFVILPIVITMVGTYDHIARFMSAVANLSKIVKIGDFIMSNQAAEASASNTEFPAFTIDTPLKMQLTLEVYESTI